MYNLITLKEYNRIYLYSLPFHGILCFTDSFIKCVFYSHFEDNLIGTYPHPTCFRIALPKADNSISTFSLFIYKHPSPCPPARYPGCPLPPPTSPYYDIKQSTGRDEFRFYVRGLRRASLCYFQWRTQWEQKSAPQCLIPTVP